MKSSVKMPSSKKLVYVVHEHWATHHHFDLRLERKGILKSWAIPKNIKEANKRRILAIQVDDHSYNYKDFEGIIEEGQYGAGKVKIWDKGTYEPISIKDKKIVFKINGEKLKGIYVLVKFKAPNNWLFFKKKE